MPTATLGEIELVCPSCRKPKKGGVDAHPLRVSAEFEGSGSKLHYGFLSCPKCKAQYPIVEDIPCVMRGVREWLGSEMAASPNPPELPDRMTDFPVYPEQGRSWQQEKLLVDAFMEFHYGYLFPSKAGRPEWAQNARYWKTVMDFAESPDSPVLDLGCSVGRMSFEMAKGARVIGLDFRLEALRAASRLMRSGRVSFSRKMGANLVEELDAEYRPPGEPFFIAANALDPPFMPGAFGTVAALNLIDNVPNPMLLIGQMDALLRPGGIMIIGSPYEWREDITPQPQWLTAPDMDSADFLRNLLLGKLLPESGLAYSVEEEVSELGWTMRNHERYYSHFISHLLRARKSLQG